MPFTFKLSQRLARMRDSGLAACRLLPAAGPGQVVNVVLSPDAVTLVPPFKHKFSARWAQLRGVLLLGLLAAGGCDLQKLLGLLFQVASVSVTPSASSIVVSGTMQLVATPKDASGSPVSGRLVTWASSAPAVTVVSGNGLATGMTPGVATITAMSEGQSGTATVTVTVSVSPAPVASVTLSPATASMIVGGKQQFTVTLRDATGAVLTGRTVGWNSSNFGVAKMDLATPGLFIGVAAGTATITAISEGVSATATLTVS
jgi:uncharacterized protein YjdB